MIVVALIGRRSDRVQGRRVVVAGRIVRRAAGIHEDENSTQQKPERKTFHGRPLTVLDDYRIRNQARSGMEVGTENMETEYGI